MTINQAIRHYGSVAKLAKALRLSPKSIYAWGYRGRMCPPENHQWRLQELTGGELKVERWVSRKVLEEIW